MKPNMIHAELIEDKNNKNTESKNYSIMVNSNEDLLTAHAFVRDALMKNAKEIAYISYQLEENYNGDPSQGLLCFINATPEQQYSVIKELLETSEQIMSGFSLEIQADGFDVNYHLQQGVVKSSVHFHQPDGEEKFLNQVRSGEVSLFLPDLETNNKSASLEISPERKDEGSGFS